jgi:hypothetical protein
MKGITRLVILCRNKLVSCVKSILSSGRSGLLKDSQQVATLAIAIELLIIIILHPVVVHP